MTRITPQLPPSENSRICTRRNERCADGMDVSNYTAVDGAAHDPI